MKRTKPMVELRAATHRHDVVVVNGVMIDITIRTDGSGYIYVRKGDNINGAQWEGLPLNA